MDSTIENYAEIYDLIREEQDSFGEQLENMFKEYIEGNTPLQKKKEGKKENE